MEIRRLGSHGLALSALSLGTLTWGNDTDEIEAAELLATYLDGGGTTLDVPSDWVSPTFSGRLEAVGAAISQVTKPTDLVIVVHSGTLPEPTGTLLRPLPTTYGPRTSKRNLLASLDEALAALQTDHVDLWVLHGPRQGIAVEEMRRAAEFALSTGRAAYVGVAGLGQWDLGEITAGPTGMFAGLAAPFSLLEATAKESLMAPGSSRGLGFLALSPLAQGVLTGKYRHSTPPDSRAATSHLSSLVSPYLTERHARVVEAVSRAATSLDTTPAAVSLAWVLAQPAVTSAVIGPRNARQLEQLMEAPPLVLQRELRDVLSEVAVTN